MSSLLLADQYMLDFEDIAENYMLAFEDIETVLRCFYFTIT